MFHAHDLRKVGGGESEVDFNTINLKAQDFDKYTGEALPNDFVRAAMIKELSCLREKAVWTAAGYADMKPTKDSTFVRTRRALCNKGSLKAPGVGARLAACEVAKDKVSAFYASTPPLESKKALFSRYAAQRKQDGKPLALSFTDIKKAYFNGVLQRNIFMAPPGELGLGKIITQQTKACTARATPA